MKKLNKVNTALAKVQPMAFCSSRIVSSAKVYKEYVGEGLEKVLIVSLRSGGSYDNLKSTKEARANGDAPAENAGLPWGQWEVYPYQIGHKGKEYSRVYFKRCKVIYLLNGKRVQKREVAHMLKASKPNKGETFTVTSENIKSIKVKGKELLDT
jgi:hypothetical protein